MEPWRRGRSRRRSRWTVIWKFLRHSLRALGILLVFGACAMQPALAQNADTGSLSGHVTDPSGAVLPKASITVTGHGKQVSARSDEVGFYEVRNLAPGNYTVSA